MPHSRLRGACRHEVRDTTALPFFAPAGSTRHAWGESLFQVRPLRDAGEPDGHGSPGHKACKAMHAVVLQRKAVSDSPVAMDAKFYAYGEELEQVEVFKHLRRLIAFDDGDTQAVRGKLAEARRVWARISRILRAENAYARVCGMFYKATVQSVLLFGSKTWVLSPATLQRLDEAVRGNLAKARRVWARISRVLRVGNVFARVCGLFYEAKT